MASNMTAIRKEPIHLLKQDHRIIERALHALDGLCLRLEWGQSVPQDALAELVNFLSAFANRYHHGKEETYLFPALERHGIAREGGPLGAMEAEHETERKLTSEMVRAIESYRNIDAAAASRFIDAARKYIDHLLVHIEHEDNVLFRLADAVLDDSEKSALFESFRQAESQLMLHSPQEYDSITAELEERWAL